MADADADANARPDRGPRIPQAKLINISPTPAISIFHRKDRNQPVQILRNNFSRDAANIFCNRIFQDLRETTSKSFIITGGDRAVFEQIFQWIDSCVVQSKLIQFEQLDDTLPYVMTNYAEIIVAAEYLGIPARDLGDGLKKRMHHLARKTLISWDEVESIYEKFTEHQVCEYAAASVFYAWWSGRLEENPGDMEFLSELRDEIPQLDQDLHDWCERNEEEVKGKWADKKAKKEAQDAEGGEGFADENKAFEPSGVDEGWDTGSQTVANSGDWEASVKSTTDEWADENPAGAQPAVQW